MTKGYSKIKILQYCYQFLFGKHLEMCRAGNRLVVWQILLAFSSHVGPYIVGIKLVVFSPFLSFLNIWEKCTITKKKQKEKKQKWSKFIKIDQKCSKLHCDPKNLVLWICNTQLFLLTRRQIGFEGNIINDNVNIINIVNT